MTDNRRHRVYLSGTSINFSESNYTYNYLLFISF